MTLQFIHCSSYLLLCNRPPQNVRGLQQHLLSPSFSGSGIQVQLPLSNQALRVTQGRLGSSQDPMGRIHFQAHLRGSWQDSDLSRLLDSCLNSPELLAGDSPQFPAMEAFPQSSSQYGSRKRECRKQNASNPNTEVIPHHVPHLLFITSESLGSAHAPRDSIKTEYQEVEFVGRYVRSCLPFTHNFVVKMNRLNKIFNLCN